MAPNAGVKTGCIDTWKYIFLSFAVIILFCSVKNYLVYLVYNTPSCKILCPSVFAASVFVVPDFVQKVFDFQSWLLEVGQDAVGITGYVKRLVFSSLVVAPLIEESMYRGPLFLLREHLSVFVWWFFAVFLSALFALSHGFSGLSLLPMFLLGAGSSWLLMTTRKFWPCLVLHFLYNLHVLSNHLYQSLFWGD